MATATWSAMCLWIFVPFLMASKIEVNASFVKYSLIVSSEKTFWQNSSESFAGTVTALSCLKFLKESVSNALNLNVDIFSDDFNDANLRFFNIKK